MEEKDWLVRSMLYAIENPSKPVNVDSIAKALDKSDRTIQNKIKSLGYKWDSKLRRYDYIGEEAEPKDIDFRTLFDNKDNPIKRIAKKEISKGEKEVSAATIASNKKVSPKENNSDYDMIDMLLNSEPKAKKVYKGFYIDEDIANIIDSVDKKKKSELVNQCLRKVFKEKGLL